MSHKELQKRRAENNTPINFTCGKCRCVHPYNKDFSCDYDKDVKEDGEV